MRARQVDALLTATGAVMILALLALPGCGAAHKGILDSRCGRACARALPSVVGAQAAGAEADGTPICLCWYTEVQTLVVPREEW